MPGAQKGDRVQGSGTSRMKMAKTGKKARVRSKYLQDVRKECVSKTGLQQKRGVAGTRGNAGCGGTTTTQKEDQKGPSHGLKRKKSPGGW